MGAIISAILGSGALGSIFGFIGSFINGWLALKKQKQDNKFELDKMKEERETLRMEIDRDVQIAQVEAKARVEEADANALTASYDFKEGFVSEDILDKIKGPKARGVGVFFMLLIDLHRRAVRPNLTYLATFGLAWMVHYMLTLIPLDQLKVLNPSAFWEIYIYTLQTAVFLASAAISWWFGNRAQKWVKDNIYS